MATGRTAICCLVLGLLGSFALAQTRATGSATRSRAEAKALRKKTPPTWELRKAEAVPFAIPPATAITAMNYCDAEGNVYLQYTTAKPRIGPGQVIIPATPLNQPVTKLSLDSQSTTEFDVRSLNGYRSLTPLEFSVDRFGDVYRLYQAQPTSLPDRGFLSLRLVVVKFSDDGSVDSTFRLQNPPGSVLDVMRFLPFADGNLLVAGDTGPIPASQGGGSGTPYPRFKVVHHSPAGYGPFVGIFDSRGNFVERLHLAWDTSLGTRRLKTTANRAPESAGSHAVSAPKAAETASKANPRRVPRHSSSVAPMWETIMTPGPEDTAYLLRPSNPPVLYTLSSDGRVIHEASVKGYSAPKAQPISMSTAGRADVMIYFRTATVGRKGKVHFGEIFAVVNPATGKAIAAYRLPKNSNVLPACAAGPNEFEFIGSSKHGRMEVVKFTGP